MADVLSEKARELIDRPVLASLATLNRDGSPQISPLWIDLDGDNVVFNTAATSGQGAQHAAGARVAATVIDPDDPYNVVAFRGTVVDVTTEAPMPTSTRWPRSTSVSTSTPCGGRARCGSGCSVRTDHIAMQRNSIAAAP